MQEPRQAHGGMQTRGGVGTQVQEEGWVNNGTQAMGAEIGVLEKGIRLSVF